MPSFEKFTNKLREKFDNASNQVRLIDVLILWYLYKLDRKTFLGEATYKELEYKFNLTNSSISRTINRLGAKHRKGYKGLGLVETQNDPAYGKRFLVTLSKTCVDLIKYSV